LYYYSYIVLLFIYCIIIHILYYYSYIVLVFIYEYLIFILITSKHKVDVSKKQTANFYIHNITFNEIYHNL